jgi:hypothetical protein
METIFELAKKVDRLIHDEYQERLNDFFFEIRQNVSNKLVDDDSKYHANFDAAYFFFNMKDDKELYRKLISYLDVKNIVYSIDTYDLTMVIMKFDQFYNKVYDDFMKKISQNINLFLMDVDIHVAKRIITNRKYKIQMETYNVAFRFNLEYDKELYDKLKNFLNHKNIEYIEHIDYKGLTLLNVIEILPTEFIDCYEYDFD